MTSLKGKGSDVIKGMEVTSLKRNGSDIIKGMKYFQNRIFWGKILTKLPAEFFVINFFRKSNFLDF